MATYTAEHFARSLGGKPQDWGMDPDEQVDIDVNCRITVGDRFFGHVTSHERAALEGKSGPPGSFDIQNAIAYINRHRRTLGQAPLSPFEAGWTDEDVVAESGRIARLPNLDEGWAPGLAPTAAFAGAGLGGELATRTARWIAGTDTDALAVVFGSRIAGQVAGASSLAAMTAPAGLGLRAALGAAAGAWVPYLGIPLGALGTYLATRGRVGNPRPGRAWWIGGAVAAALLVGGVAYAKLRGAKTDGPTGVPGPLAAVDQAIGMLGEGADVVELADVAYTIAYPDCPPKLDPEDPTHEVCIGYWLALRDIVIDRLPPPSSRPSEAKEGLSTTGPAADMRGWLESLTQSQRAGLREIIGASYYDPIKGKAYAGDDAGVVNAVLRFKAAVEETVAEDKLQALANYLELSELLGPKLDELMRLAKKYEGKG